MSTNAAPADDSDIDALLGDTLAKVGESAKVLEENARLQAASSPAPRKLVDPRTLPVRFSRLKIMGQSPAHYFHACQDDMEETLAMRLGSGVHGLLLGEPGDVVLYDGIRNGRVWDRFRARNDRAKAILNAREWAHANGVANAVRRNKHAARLLEDVVLEERIDWMHGSRACRSTPDVRGKRFVADLKTTRSAEPGFFNRDSFNRQYHVQLPFYDEAVVATGGRRADELYIIAVETTEPNAVTVFRIPDELRELGTRTWSLWFERLLVCEASDTWPEYAQSIVDLEAPFAIGSEDLVIE